MKERPILFTDAMVRAILEGRKTQTRRLVKPQPVGRIDPVFSYGSHGLEVAFGPENLRSDGGPKWWRHRYGSCGDYLYVRECWARFHIDQDSHELVYRADTKIGDCIPTMVRWRPSIHMPRSVSRILLEVTGVRVERVQEITKDDAIAEGVTQRGNLYCMDWSPVGKPLAGMETVQGEPYLITDEYIANDNPGGAFATYWDNINGDASWDANPWVWVVEFKRLQP